MKKAHGTGCDAAKERFWRKVIGGFNPQRHTVRAWCAQQGVSEPSFYAWRRELACRDQAGRGHVRLLPVNIAPAPAVQRPTTKVIVRLAGGVQLRVSLEQLAAVLDMLEGRSC